MSDTDKYKAEVICDSMNPAGCRLTTWVLRYPRFVHSELLTHRQFSRCSSSSRAIPIKKMIDQVESNPVIPIYWGKNQSGMQANEELDADTREAAISRWLAARDAAVTHAKALNELGVHKQLVNRALEPWMWITIVMSTTTHANWFALRDHPDAQPEISHLARMMRSALNSSRPEQLDEGDYHLPFSREDEVGVAIFDRVKASIARCARVSYLTHLGVRSIEEDIKLYHKLTTSKPMHASPLEHVAVAANNKKMYANYCGFIQHRQIISDECVPHEFYDGE